MIYVLSVYAISLDEQDMQRALYLPVELEIVIKFIRKKVVKVLKVDSIIYYF